jgi:hypothetical protein
MANNHFKKMFNRGIAADKDWLLKVECNAKTKDSTASPLKASSISNKILYFIYIYIYLQFGV